ncbi:adenosylcobinamide kinase/adenosylcobinamide phosphate guanyltransferase [Mycolicibacter terrae]|uniref:Adenosylcobinamide kinase n=1 Tax=Mycolicibacter terrae TaxID=1788 RepID=A0AAD1I0E1_9MYCO|nr:bifunctional adenosylcobinamide kinase/adenosylcobinamide-phosphate guanylyltransferase [Mycolicibacter terrae]ORW93669.1 adenosylcobinamide kinase [Mycolicibacter terrae]BBX24199.1 adenosylcobinamide kinase/adenosylcobinamide phosphate guanyltransferase [Mycolicibacter terrae]SNV55455.1 bifunctional cobalamin biosynthesis protein CobU [Mycolicibacter terrae]
MEILLLGTGSADGWPNPFCRCASCRWAVDTGEIRAQTAALVDDVLLLDCGPEAPRSAMRHGRSLAPVRHILFTHGHPDHVGPAALLMRHWAGTAEPLDVVGPASALDQCRDWVGPDDPVRFVEVGPGDDVHLGAYRVRVLAAAHGSDIGGDAVLYDLESVGGRIFWATDTGPLPEETHAAVAGAAFDAVFLEETFGNHTGHGTEHHDLPAFAATVATLRRSGAIVEATEVVAVHLSHHNFTGSKLAAALMDSGARPGRDGEIVGASRPAQRRTLVLGGARSGKSAHAEALLAGEPAVTYLATGGMREGDPEWAERIRLHRGRRPHSWRTVETVDIADTLLTAETPVLLDCLGTWLTARMDLRRAWDDGGLDGVHADIDELVAAWRACPVRAVAVSNEVGSGVVPPTASGRLFRDLLGVLNARIATESDEVLLMVAGRPLRLPAQ